MIGILLALQVNNWNEWRKDRMKEREVLTELKENLELNVDEMTSDIRRNLSLDYSCQVILNVIENNLSYHDSLNNYFGHALSYGFYVLPSKAGYESFARIGVDIVRNQVLRKEILYLFEEEYTYMESWAKRLEDLNVETTKLRQQYLMRLDRFIWTPYDFDALIMDPKFESWVRSMMYNKRSMRRAIEECLEKTELVLQLINEELQDTDLQQ
jgi:hypothetical protein